MADKPGFLQKIGKAISHRFKKDAEADVLAMRQAESYTFDGGGTTISALLGSGRRIARSRQQIYQKFSFMEGDAIISSALRLHVTSALGGHETSGDVIFIEKSPAAQKNKKLGEMVDEIAKQCGPLLNRIAFASAYNGAAFGDSYARIYTEPGVGLVDLYADELVRPPIVQAYERGTETVGFVVYAGKTQLERLTIRQMARLKMPRQVWIPQFGVIDKAYRVALREDEMAKVPVMPSMVGGSLLYAAEEAYDNLLASLMGLVGQRWMDSIDEQMVGLNMENMTADQQTKFYESIVGFLKLSKERAAGAVRDGRPVFERIRHLLPVFSDKQLTRLDTMNQGRNATISIEDVMLHAKLLSGALGIDLSMLGFAELLSGGLGDGGFFRQSAQAAENSRVLRIALKDFNNWIIDVHTFARYGIIFEDDERPWNVNFFGSISALEAEKQKTAEGKMASGEALLRMMREMVEAGWPEKLIVAFMTQTLGMDEEQAASYAKLMAQAKPVEPLGGSGFDDTPEEEADGPL